MITITTFGYLHGPAPDATITLDLRHHFRDPHVSPDLRHLTAHDTRVLDAVLGTPGIRALLAATAELVDAYLAGPNGDGHPIRIAVGCAGGRHRAASVGIMLKDVFRDCGYQVDLAHRDLARPVVER